MASNKPTEVDSMNRLRVEAVKSRDQWREAAMAFEFRAMRVEYVIRLLVAAGHVTQEKVDEAFNLARDFKRADGVTGTDAKTVCDQPPMPDGGHR